MHCQRSIKRTIERNMNRRKGMRRSATEMLTESRTYGVATIDRTVKNRVPSVVTKLESAALTGCRSYGFGGGTRQRTYNNPINTGRFEAPRSTQTF